MEGVDAIAGDRLVGRVAIVTGAARGSGAVAAERLVDEGASVVLADLRDDLGREMAGKLGERAAYEHLDVSDAGDWSRVVAATVERFGAVHVLVNNAAILHLASLRATTLEEFNEVMAVNAAGVFLGMNAVVDAMSAAGGGSIINISSIDGVYVAPGTGAYAASKFAVRGLTKTAALEFGKFGIRVNAICPEAGNPEMIRPFIEKMDPAELRKVAPIPKPPVGRHGRMSDVADTVVFLASDESGFYTGADFVLDGGTTAGMNIDVPGV